MRIEMPMRRMIGGVMGDGREVVDLRVLQNVGSLVVDMGVHREIPLEFGVYDVTGRKVFERKMVTGRKFEWCGEDLRGRKLKSGVYFYRLRATGKELKGKVILLD